MEKPERKLIKKAVIPVTIIDNPKQNCGLVHFPTENNSKGLRPHTTSIIKKKTIITYKRQANQDNQEQENNTNARKREIEFYDLTIQPKKIRQKQFRVEIPISKGYKSSKNFTRSSELFFNFSFNNSEGKLTFINGVQDAKMQIVKSGKTGPTSKEKIDFQLKILDNRRKQPISQNKYYNEASD